MAQRRMIDAETGEEMLVDLDEAIPDRDRSGNEWKKLKNAEKERDAALAEVESYKRNEAFRAAGINPDSDPRLRYFVQGYQGDLTADAIRAAATSDGFLAAPPPPGGGQEPAVDPTAAQADASQLAQAAAISAASQGASPILGSVEDRLRDADARDGRAGVVNELTALGYPVVVTSD